MKLVIASNNEHKINEIKTILNGKFEQIVSVKDLQIDCDPEENGLTFYDNALIKARAVFACVENCAVLADDTGLCVNALAGMPGVLSARYAGNHDHNANRKKLLENLQDIEDRSAYFATAVVLLLPYGRQICAEGHVDGRILKEESGQNGFGYDCLFFSDELNKSFADASLTEKNAVSHRARALNNLLEKLDAAQI